MRTTEAEIVKGALFVIAIAATVPILVVFRGPVDVAVASNPWMNQEIFNGTAFDDSVNVVETAEVMHLHPRDAIFLHVGKAAGGSIMERFHQWNLQVPTCHPVPCYSMLAGNPNSGVIVPIRDPVDRFVSAFYWRLMVLCNPDGDQREGGTGHPAVHPELFCKNNTARRRDEVEGLFHLFRRNASLLAESLCSANATLASLAVQTMRSIEHARTGIVQWLDFDWTKRNIFAVVVLSSSATTTKGDNRKNSANSLPDQVDAAVEWLYERLSFESTASFANQTRLSQIQQRETTTTSHNNRHSSQSLKRDLSAAGAECVAKYYQRDYELLRRHKKRLCKTADCLAGIQSILDQRRFLFDDDDDSA